MADEYLTIDGSQDLATRRRLADRLVEMATEPGGVSVVSEQIGEVPVTVFTPERATGGTIVHAHGGHSMCSLLSHHRLGAHLALRTARRVTLVGYRRTPEHHWMVAIEDVITVMRAQAADHLTLSGDSAGGSIAVVAALETAGTQESPDSLVLLSPWLDRTLSGDSMSSNVTSDLFVTGEGLRVLAAEILGDDPPEVRHGSPLFSDLSSLPPTYVQVAADEVLLDDSVRFVERARRARVDVTLHIEPGVQHAWHLAAGNLPEADSALNAVGTHLDRTASGGHRHQ